LSCNGSWDILGLLAPIVGSWACRFPCKICLTRRFTSSYDHPPGPYVYLFRAVWGAAQHCSVLPDLLSVLCLHHSAHCCPVLPDLFNDSPLVCFTTITPTCRYCCGGGAPLALHGASQDNYKTTTRQLQDNSQDNPQDNSKHFAKSTFRPKQSNY
jgi:hypothetical protein